MAYTPINAQVYGVAFAAALAGMAASGRVPSSTDPNSSAVQNTAKVADAFAQEFDQRWGNATVDLNTLACIQEICEAGWESRAGQAAAPYTTPSTYQAWCDSLVAYIQGGELYVNANITPGPGSGSILVKGNITIDGNIGNDITGNGSAGSPFQTWGRYWTLMSLAAAPLRRIVLSTNTTVNYRNPVAGDKITTVGLTLSNATLRIQGDYIVDRTSAFSAVQNHVLGGNLEYQVIDLTVPTGSWAPDIAARRIVFNQGGNYFYLDQDQSGAAPGRARVSQPAAEGAFAPTLGTLSVAAYTLGHFTPCAIDDIAYEGIGSVAFAQLNFNGSTGGLFETPLQTSGYRIINCTFVEGVVALVGSFANCYFGNFLQSVGQSNISIYAGSHAPGVFIGFGGNLFLDGNFYLKRRFTSITTNAPSSISLLALLDGGSLNQANKSFLRFGNGAYGARSIWGTGDGPGTPNLTFTMNAGSQFNWAGVGFVLADCPIAGAGISIDKYGAGVSYPFDPATGTFNSGTGVLPLLANIAAGPPGGFSANLNDPRVSIQFGD